MKKTSIHILKVLLMCLVALVGVFVFEKLHLPLPWLLGSTIACAIASRFEKLPISSPKYLGFFARMVLGLAIASSFTPAIFPHLTKYLYSVALIIPFVIFIALFGTWYYIRVAKMDVMSAFFSAMPGGLFEMVTLGEAKGANVRVITMTQSARLVIIVCLLPFILQMIFHSDLAKDIKIAPSFSEVPYYEMFILTLAGIIGWLIAEKLKISGAVLLGGMFGGIAVYATGVVVHKPPEEILHFAQLILGIITGTSFKGVSRYELFLTLRATFGYMLVLTFISILFMFFAYLITGFSLIPIILAFSPGGQSEMLVIAMVIANDFLPYIVLHHVLRTFVIMALAPIFSAWMEKHKKPYM